MHQYDQQQVTTGHVQFYPDDHGAKLLAQAKAVADQCAKMAATTEEHGDFPVQEFRLIAEAGLLAAPLRHNLGGFGLGIAPGSMLNLLRILKHIGRGNLAVGRIYEGHVNALQLIQRFGTSEQQERYATDARDRHCIFAVWNAEAADGVKLHPLDAGHYRLEGAKTFASGAGHVQRPFVNGMLPDGRWQMCVVPMEQVETKIDPSWWQPIGMRASTSYRIDFTGVELGPDDLIGQPDEYHQEPWFSGGAIRFAAVQLGGAEALFDETRYYLRQSKRTEDPFQRMRAGEMAIALESGNLWLQGVAEMADRPVAVETMLAYTGLMRMAIEAICLDVIRLVERTVGARGLLKPHPIERIIRDLTMYLRQPAPDAALANAGGYVLEMNDPTDQLWFGHVDRQ